MIRLSTLLINQAITSSRSCCPVLDYMRLNSAFICNNTFYKRNISTPSPKENSLVEQTQWPPCVWTVIKNSQELGFTEDEIKKLISSQPELRNSSLSSWKDILVSLYDGGFNKDEIFIMLEKWPKLLKMKRKELDLNIHAWLRCGFGKDLYVEILTTYPSFLGVSHMHVSKRIKQYQLHFESKKRVGKLLLLAPNTLEESYKILIEKINYLDELCTEKSDVAASGVLACSLFHIKARHEFLIRAGFYKRPQKDFHKRLSRNPKLKSIVNTTDREFVGNSRLSMFEYKVFLEMFEKELDEEKDEAGSSSDDDDDI